MSNIHLTHAIHMTHSIHLFEDRIDVFYIVYPTNLMSAIMKFNTPKNYWYTDTTKIEHLSYEKHIYGTIIEIHDTKHPFNEIC